MSPLADHERALLLLLREGDRPADAMRAVARHSEVAAWHMPSLWTFERSGMDPMAALPGVKAIDLENLDQVLDALVRLHTPEKLEEIVSRIWRVAEEPVRSHYLDRGTLETFASIFRMGPKSVDLPPPPAFEAVQVYMHRFEVEYRLRREGPPEPSLAIAEEASLCFYPFDPANSHARRESDLGEGNGAVLELFAYAGGRDRHREVLESVARSRGARVVDTA